MSFTVKLLALALVLNLSPRSEPGPQAQGSDSAEFNYYLVETAQPMTTEQLAAVQNTSEVLSVARFDQYPSEYFSRVYTVKVAARTQQMLARLQGISFVSQVEEPSKIELMTLTPANEARPKTNDLYFNYQWALWNNGQTAIHKIRDIESETYRSNPEMDIGWENTALGYDTQMRQDVIVAVLDTGIDYRHPDLEENIYHNTVECSPSGHIKLGRVEELPDADGDGEYRGDCIGWNFAARADTNSQNKPNDDFGHGTHVAGIIAARGGNRQGISGLSNRIKIMPLRVTFAMEGQEEVPLTLSDRVAKAVLYATRKGAKVINLSMGWPRSEDKSHLREAFRVAREAGVTIVAAAGNNNNEVPVFPCAYDNVICVGAMTLNGSIASYSNYGSHIDLLAPGDNILSTWPPVSNSIALPNRFADPAYEVLDGTSQASPYVAGMAAILRGTNPAMRDDEVQARLMVSALAVPNGERKTMHGLPKLDAALAATARPVVRPSFKDLDRVIYRKANMTFSFNLPIKYYWQRPGATRVRVTSNSPAIRVEGGDYTISSWNEAQRKSDVTVRARISDENAHSKFAFSVEVQAAGETRRYQHEIFVSRDLVSDPEAISVPIVLSAETRAKSGVNEMLNHLTPVQTIPSQLSTPVFYMKRTTPAGLELTILELRGQQYQEVGSQLLPEANQVSFIRRVDLNYDGRLDYLVKSAFPGAGSTRENPVHTIQHSFFDESFQPLFTKNHWRRRLAGRERTEESTHLVPNMMPMSLLPYQDTQLGRMAIPVFMTPGYATQADRSQNSLAFEPASEALRRLYYYVPQAQTDGSTALQMRDFTNREFYEGLRARLNSTYRMDVRFISDINFIRLLPQPSDELQNAASATIKTVFSVTEGNDRRYFILSINGQQLLQRAYDVTEANYGDVIIDRHDQTNLIDLNSETPDFEAGAVYASHSINDDLGGEILALTPGEPAQISHRLSFEQSDRENILLDAFPAYTREGKLYSFFEARDTLIFKLTQRNGATTSFSAPIGRSSFVIGRTFLEYFRPIARGDRGLKQPAFYVDSTQITSRHVYVWSATDRGLVAPMSLNIDVPPQCKSLNPVNYGQHGGFAFSLLCGEQSGQGVRWSIKHLMID